MVLSWLRRAVQPAPISSPVSAVANAALRSKVDEDIPRYPPFMKGLPVRAPEQLVDAQFELLEQIQSSVIVSKLLYEKHYLGAIRRFAAFAHLLPASQSHHHRGAGGLLRHSMECGLMALQGSDKMLLDLGKAPSHRRELEPRLQLAAFLGGLCHDAGKPATDVVVTSHDREQVWQPIRENLWDWAQRNGIQSYFLEWRAGRHKQHQALSNLLADRIITTETLAWIAEGGTELVVWLMESLNENPTTENRLFDLVKRADQQSVKRDLETMGAAMAGYEVGVPVERAITDAMRNLVRQGLWTVNQPGARVWNIGGHIFLVWPAAGHELAAMIREEGIPGIPRTSDSILDMLVERQLAFLPEGQEEADSLWRIVPDCVKAKIPDIQLQCIRLRSDTLVSSLPIEKTPGVVLQLAATQAPVEAASDHPNEAVQSAEVNEQAGPPPEKKKPRERSKPIATTATAPEPQEPPPSETKVDAEGARRGPSFPHDPETGEIPERVAEAVQLREEPVADSKPEEPPAVASKPKQKAGRSDPPNVRFDGAAGEAIKALVDDLRAGTRKWDLDVRVDSEEHVLITWPSAFAGYGLTGKVLLEEMTVNEWLWIDEDNPLRKLQDFDVGSGDPIKVLRLDHDASYAFLHAARPAVQEKQSSKEQGAPAGPAPVTRQPPPVETLAAGVDVESVPKAREEAGVRHAAVGASVPPRANAAQQPELEVSEGPAAPTGQAASKNPSGRSKTRTRKPAPEKSMPSLIPVPHAGQVVPQQEVEKPNLTPAEAQLADQVAKRASGEQPSTVNAPPRIPAVSLEEIIAALSSGASNESSLKPGWREYALQEARATLGSAGIKVQRPALFALCELYPERLCMAKGLLLYCPNS